MTASPDKGEAVRYSEREYCGTKYGVEFSCDRFLVV